MLNKILIIAVTFIEHDYRWWVAAHGTQHHNVSVSHSLLNSSAETVQKIRVVLRFLLANLYDIPESDLSATSKLNFHVIDKYLLHQLLKVQQEVILYTYITHIEYYENNKDWKERWELARLTR